MRRHIKEESREHTSSWRKFITDVFFSKFRVEVNVIHSKNTGLHDRHDVSHNFRAAFPNKLAHRVEEAAVVVIAVIVAVVVVGVVFVVVAAVAVDVPAVAASGCNSGRN